MPGSALSQKFSAPGRIDFLRENALPGVMTEPQPAAPPALPRGQTGIFFRLKYEENEWTTHVAEAGELAVFIVNAPRDVKLNLIVVLAGA